jgi:hypothetical protein
MLIKLKGIHDDKLGSKDAKRIEGVRLDNGEPWERKIFADARDLRGELEKFGIGEVINVKQIQKGKWWNVSGFEKPTDELIEKVKSGGGSGGGGGSNTYQKSAPAKSTWNGRTGEAYDRSAAIYLALDLLKTNATAPIKPEYLYIMADEVFNYIHNGVNPTVDPLEPPV